MYHEYHPVIVENGWGKYISLRESLAERFGVLGGRLQYVRRLRKAGTSWMRSGYPYNDTRGEVDGDKPG